MQITKFLKKGLLFNCLCSTIFNMKNKIHLLEYKTKIGNLLFGSFDKKLCLLNFNFIKKQNYSLEKIKNFLDADIVESEDKVISLAKIQIDEYLAGIRKDFSVPILLIGTEFQKEVWTELLKIPYGATTSYLELAKKINRPKAVRAVGSANGANPIPIIVPCHRVINSNGNLGGYGGGLELKKYLLNLEKL